MNEKRRCEFYPEVRCERVGERIVKCEDCGYLRRFEEEMIAEEEEFFREVDDVRRRGVSE